MTDAFTQEAADRLFSDEALAPSAPLPSGGPIETEDQADSLFSDAALAPQESSALGAAARSAELGVIPAITGLSAAGAGTALGIAAAPVFGPLAPLAGGLASMFLGAEAGAAAQDYALSKMPDDAKKRFGLDEEQRLVDAAQHPYASQLGGLIPYVVTSSPFSPKAVEKEMTALERFMQKPVVQRGIGGGMMGAWELGQEALNDEVDWTKVAVATAFGVIFNHQNRVGQYLHNIGARPVERITAPIRPEQSAEAEPDFSRSMGGALFSPRNMPDPRNPTLREVDAAGVMGPGNDEYTYMGLKRRPALEELFSHKRLEEEYDALYGPQLPTPEQIASTARKIEPELFAARDALEDQRRSLETAIDLYRKPPIEEYDSLRSQRQALEDQLAETKNKAEQRRIRAQIRDLTGQIDDTWSRMQGEGSLDETLTGLFRELAGVNAQIREQGKDVASATRRAAEAIGAGEMVLEQPFAEEPSAAPAASGIAPEMFTPARGSRPIDAAPEPSAKEAAAAIAPARPEVDIEAEKARIIEASKREHMAAGVSADQAEEYAKLDAARYVTRAAWFKGALGTPYELYVSRHAKINLWEPGKRPPPATTPPVEPGPISPDAVAATNAMRAAEARLAEAPPETPPAETAAAPVPGRLPEAPTQEPVVEGEVSVAPAEPAEIAPNEPVPAAAGPAAGDRIVLSGTPYRIASIDDQSVRLTPTRTKDKASALSLPRKAFDQMFVEHAAEAGVAQGEKITLNGEVLDAKLAEAIRKKLAEKEEAARGAPASERTADEMALRQRMLDEVLKSDEEFYAPADEPLPSDDPNFMAGVREKIIQEPQTLLGFVRANGGIQDFKGELRSQDMHKRFPGLVRKNGRPLDSMREIAEEAGYLPEGSVPDDLVQALLSDEPVYSSQDFDQAEAYRLQQQTRALEKRISEAKAELREYYPEVEQEFIDEASMMMAYDDLTLDEAFEAAIRKVTVESPNFTPDEDIGRAFDEWIERTAKTEANRAAREDRSGSPGGQKGGVGAQGVEGAPQAQIFEAGAEGKPQAVIPGAERLSNKDIAERRANQPLRGGNQSPGGMFDEGNTNQRDLFQRDKNDRALGKFVMRLNGLREIWFKPEANATTIIHEHGHEFLEQLREDAGHEAAPQQLRDDLETIKRWVGWGGKESANKNGAFSTKQHEKFARGFERYLYDGVAPSKELAGVFQRFARWMREIYNAALGIKRPDAIPAEIRAVFDRLLAVEPHSVTIAGEVGMRRTMADAHEAESRLATPESAGPMADRARAELTRTIAETPEEIRNELAAAAERVGAERASTDLGAGVERSGGMASDRGRPEAVSRRKADGARGGEKPDSNRPSTPSGDRAGGDGGSGDDYFTRDGRYVDKAGNIRLENLTNAEDLRAAIREIAYGHDGFIEARRGKVPDEAVLSLAEEIGFEGAEDLVNNWVVGQAFNAEEIMALRLLMRDSARDLHAKAKAVADGADRQAVRDYALAKERHVSIQKTVSGATAEWGRAGRSFRDISGDVKGRAIEKIIRESTAQTLFQLRDEANLLAGLDSEVAINRQTRHMASSYGEGLLEYATNNLISGPITHTVYTIANQTQAIYKALLETPARAVISQALRAAGKDIAPEEMVRFGEAWQQILGMGQGFAPGLKAAGQSLRSGLTTRLPRETMRNLPGIRPGQEVVEAPMVDMAYTLKEVVPDIFGALRGSVDAMAAYSKMLALGVEGEPFFRWKNNPLYKIPDMSIRGVTVPFGGVINSPSRLVSALHAFNRIQFYFMELNAEAFRRASAELERGQIAPQDFERRVAELKIHPDALMIDRASQAATESTQMAPGGAITQRLSRLVNSPIGGPNGPPLLRFIDPFVHISSNVLSGAFLKRTPLGFLSGPIRDDLAGKNGRLAQTNAMARMVMGTSVLATFGVMKASGYITGAAPDDPAEAATWRLAGYQPYSIKINGTWHPFHRLGVLGLLMGIGADIYDVSDHLSKAAGNYAKDDLKKMDEELMQAFGALLHSISNNVMEESFMRGPAELMKAVEGGENAMSRYVRNFVSTMFTPFSVGMNQVARVADPVSRQARSLTDAILNKIPGMSKGLYPRRDIWGEPLMSQTSMATSAPSRDPVSLEMYRLGVHKAPVERKIMGVELSEQQYDDYQRIAGRMTKMQMDIMVRSPRWQSTPDPIKKMEMEKMIDAQRAAARNMMMLRYRSIPQEAFSAKKRARTEIQTNQLP